MIVNNLIPVSALLPPSLPPSSDGRRGRHGTTVLATTASSPAVYLRRAGTKRTNGGLGEGQHWPNSHYRILRSVK